MKLKLTLTILSASALFTYGQDYFWDQFATGFSFPTDVTVNSTGAVFVADYFHSQIQKIDPDGTVSVFAGSGTAGAADGTGTAAQFSNPTGVAVDATGNVFVADRGNRLIRKITPAGVVTTIAGQAGVVGGDDGPGSSATFRYLHSLSVDSSGNVFVADREGATIRMLKPNGTNYDVSTIAGVYATYGYVDGTNTDTRFNNDSPTGVPVDSAGNVYVCDHNAHTIRKLTKIGSDWVATTIAGKRGTAGNDDGIGTNATFNLPYNGAFDSAGNLYIADTSTGNGANGFGSTIRKLTLVGTNWVVTTIGGTLGIFGNDSPFGVTVDYLGNLYAADYGHNRVVKGIPPASPPKITSIKIVGGNVQIDFISSESDTPDMFTLVSSGTVNGTYNDVAPPATITQQGTGSFRAVTPLNGSSQFYKIRK
jgi:streptogramin lyase